MKKLYLLSFLFLLCFQVGRAQQAGEWTPCSENPIDGTFGINGVRAYYQLSACNNVETIFIKIENLNNYPVKVGWRDLVFTNDDKQLSLGSKQDSVVVAPKGESVGTCGGKYLQLAVNLSDFGTDKLNFMTFRVTNFDFVLMSNK
jgi:hypothetical protein